MKNTILTILLFPVILIFLLVIFILTPFDYLRYKKTKYYKDTHEKYSWFCTSSYYIKFYDLLKKENLPIDYYRCKHELADITGYGYFIYKDTLILSDYELCYDAEKNVWTVEVEDEYVDVKEEIESVIKSCNKFLKADVCKRAVVLIDVDIFAEHPNTTNELFELVPVYNEDICTALKRIVNN